MTDDLGWVSLGVKPDASGFSSSLSRQVGSGMDVESRRIGARFGAGFRRAAIVGGIGLAGALTAGVKLAASSLGEAEESVKVGRQTNAVLKSTGGIARVSAREVGQLANQLSRKAGIDDEVVQSGENMLLTFRGVRDEAGKGNDIFKQATKASLDMSVALGRDLNSSVLQVGKALNDPARGMTMLSRAGVVFTEQQRDQIKALSESGDQLGAQKIILRELTKEFGGSAKSQATESDKLNVAFLNLKESIGKELLPYMDDLKRFIRKEGIPAVHDFFNFMHDTGVPAIKKVAGFLKDAGGHAKDLIGHLKDLPDPAKYAGLVALIGGVGAAKLRGGGGPLGGAGRVLGISAPVKVFVTNPGFGKSGTGTTTTGGKGSGRGTAAALLGLPILDELSGGKASDIALHPLRELGAEFSMPFTSKGRRELFGPSIKEQVGQLKASAQYWHDYEFNGMAAFRAVDKAIEHATPLMVRYNRVLDGTPRQIKTWVGLSGYEKAIGQINTLKAGIDALASRGLDNGVPYLHGGMSVGTMNVQANDWNDIVQKGQKRAQQANLGGRP